MTKARHAGEHGPHLVVAGLVCSGDVGGAQPDERPDLLYGRDGCEAVGEDERWEAAEELVGGEVEGCGAVEDVDGLRIPLYPAGPSALIMLVEVHNQKPNVLYQAT